MSGSGWVAAVDLGATSGRVMLGHVGPGTLEVRPVHRFANEPVLTPDGLHWNILELYRQILYGLGQALREQPGLRSVGVDSWAVDYGLVAGDRLVGSPFHYRDGRGEGGVDTVHQRVPEPELHQAGGLQFMPFNTLYQLTVDAAEGAIPAGSRMLMVPDLIGFWLTGRQVAERTNASTTGLLDVRSRQWNTSLIDDLDLPASLFGPLQEPGERVGPLRAAVVEELGGGAEVEVVAVGSHDTASAVVAVPMTGTDAAYISSGTWSLVGVELDQPVLSEEARTANFTNEGGVDGRIRFLHNVMGLWLLSESVRRWEADGQSTEMAELLAAAAEVDGPVTVFDADDPSLLPPGDMPSRIATLAQAQGRRGAAEPGRVHPQHPGEPGRGVRAHDPGPPAPHRSTDRPGPCRRRGEPEPAAVPADRQPDGTGGAGRSGGGDRHG